MFFYPLSPFFTLFIHIVKERDWNLYCFLSDYINILSKVAWTDQPVLEVLTLLRSFLHLTLSIFPAASDEASTRSEGNNADVASPGHLTKDYSSGRIYQMAPGSQRLPTDSSNSNSLMEDNLGNWTEGYMYPFQDHFTNMLNFDAEEHELLSFSNFEKE